MKATRFSPIFAISNNRAPTIYVLQVDAALRHEGDFDGAAQSCQAMLNVTGVFKGDPFLVSYLVRAAEHAITVAAIEGTLGRGRSPSRN